MNKRLIILSYKLLNTATSYTLRKTLTKPWSNEDSEQRKQVRINCGKELSKTLSTAKGVDIRGYLDKFCSSNGIKVTKHETRGLIRSMDLQSYGEVDQFLFEDSAIWGYHNADQEVMVRFHDVVRKVMEVLVCKNTLEEGSSDNRYNEIMDIILSKPTQFIEQGYVCDFFVGDRRMVEFHKDSIGGLYCDKNYLSTQTTYTVEPKEYLDSYTL
ncbi:hypothetical protein A3715_33510 [Oleiphilus sp. HI0009]|nr:hypothetical protein A3715_14015 [Oleiphilus sp. HI0009]KZX82668.1 hypothetical protein A3715_33510 [Oleiphilus sp. HI0009]